MARSDDACAADQSSKTIPGAILAETLSALGDGDRGALGEVFGELGDMVFRTCVRLTGSRADAEDVTQDVFVRLPIAIRGFAGSPAQFPAWLRRVAVRASLMRNRSGRRRDRMRTEAVVSLVTRPDRTAERLSLEAALRELNDEQRTVFLLKEVEGYDHAEIADLVGISVANSEVRLHRARKRLRELLRDSR